MEAHAELLLDFVKRSIMHCTNNIAFVLKQVYVSDVEYGGIG